MKTFPDVQVPPIRQIFPWQKHGESLLQTPPDAGETPPHPNREDSLTRYKLHCVK